ncbi:MAG: aromatic amino acid transport family protein [Desulfocapsaceae bacterium]|nr:aromatic amino acid transport family protein [Desulfocapsaceae bacterium]
MLSTSPPDTSATVATELPVDAFSWVLALFGTAVGAGILFLPIQVGQSGFWVLLLVSLLIYPTIYLGHSLYALIPSRVVDGADFFAAVGRWLPRWGAVLLHLLFISWLLILLIAYSISLTNDLGDFLSNQQWLAITMPHRIWLSFCILTTLMLLVRFARPMLIRILGGLSLLLIMLLCLVSVALVPHWSGSIACDAMVVPTPFILLKQFLLLFPLLTLSFMFFPTLSSLVRDLRCRIPDPLRRQTRLNRIIRAATLALMLFLLLFVSSFMLTISKANFSAAAHENISALALLGNLYTGTWLGELGPAISIVALLTSFLGIFIGYRESLLSLVSCRQRADQGDTTVARYENLLHGLTFIILWPLAIANVPVMAILGDLVAPLGAIFLLIVPAGVVLYIVDFRADRGPAARFVLLSGVLVLVAYFVGTAL